MTQALARVIQCGFEDLGLNSVEGNIEPDNTGSIKLVEKLGFENEGFVKQHTFNPVKDKFVDTCLYSMTRETFNGAPSTKPSS